MNIITTAAILPLLLVVAGSDVPAEGKRVGCYYLGVINEMYGTFFPEEVDASICTHLILLSGAINNEAQEIYFKSPRQGMKVGGPDLLPRLQKLKAVNPELKLILHILTGHSEWLFEESLRRNAIQNAVKWLNESGFNGLEFDPIPVDQETMADFLCEMRNEFVKYGFSVTTVLPGPREIEKETINRLASCSDYLGLITDDRNFERTTRISPMKKMKSNVDWHLERGFPSNKIILILPAFAAIFTLDDPEDTRLGAPVNGPGNNDRELLDGVGIRNKELLRKMNDSSLGWTIRRDNETQEPYAFSTTGLWTSYEDTLAMEYKARYVLENKLGGIDLVAMEYEDDEGIGGEGRFPLIRTIYEEFTGRNRSLNTNN